MTERLRPSRRFGKRMVPGDTPPYGSDLLAVPVAPSPQPPMDDADELTIFGFTDGRPGTGVVLPADEPLVRLVTENRADSIAGIPLMCAGVAAAASLWFPWLRDDQTTGMALLRRSVAVAGAGMGALGRSGTAWAPLAIVLGGALLLPLGVLLFIPSRTHRLIGVLALCAAIAVTAGVVSRLGQAGWDWGVLGRGMWFAVAAAALGLLGALKAMLRIPRVRLRIGPGAR